VVQVTAHKDGSVKVETGITGLIVMKTTQSGFVNFHKCEYTTLPEVTDRSVKTNITARWKYSREPLKGYAETYEAIKQLLIDVFAGPAKGGVYSPSVQYTQYQMATAVLKSFPEVDEIFMSMPNLHNWHPGIARFGMKDDSTVLVPAVNPNGVIELHLTRGRAKL
jgi:urate oxidase